MDANVLCDPVTHAARIAKETLNREGYRTNLSRRGAAHGTPKCCRRGVGIAARALLRGSSVDVDSEELHDALLLIARGDVHVGLNGGMG